ncbi:MAG TPA: class I SAM-dependent methyltransferase [Candidatus Saccharimonadales bacterium]|nr:class I SAM-dependent methyltransferase [Candidatus Saccharimonadales bacterium]
MTRKELVLAGIEWSKGTGLEIGPLTSPILSKKEARIFYADHMSTKDLKNKYKDAPLNIDEIAPVDFVVKKTLAEAVNGKKFEYVIACHVIEHIPDTVRWLEDIASILKPGGILALAIPDKRYIFDIERQCSTPGDVVGAYLERYDRPPSSAVYDFAAEGRKIKTAAVWKNPYKDWSTRPHLYSLDESYKMCLKNLSPGEYVDCHCYVFTPHSFIKIIRELIELGLFNFEIASFRDTNDQNIEFYVSLRKIRKNKEIKKTQLKSLPKLPAEQTIREFHKQKEALAEQVQFLTDEITLLHNSKSWKLTSPLRRTMHRLLRSKKGSP